MAWTPLNGLRDGGRLGLTMRTQLGVASLPVGGTRNNPYVEAEDEKSRGGEQAPIKMLNMKGDPEMSMKTKGHATFCPTKKMTFLPGCTPFYTNSHVFCRNLWLICHF